MQHSVELAGHGVRLEPLAPAHAAALCALVDAELWVAQPPPLPDTEPLMRGYITAAVNDPLRMAFAVCEADSGEVRGTTSFYELVPVHQRIEIGATFYGRPHWGGRTNPTCKLLLLTHAFEQLAVHRVALRCSSSNARSAAAIQRLGAVAEGALRSHRITLDGTRADTLYFSILAPEWPAVRARLQDRVRRPARG